MAGRACRPIFDRGRSGDRMFPVVETEVEFSKGKLKFEEEYFP